MPRIEDYAVVGDTQTCALVGRDGSVDWTCFPRFDSGACFAALLGKPENGRWLIAPAHHPRHVSRRYRGDTMILETELACDEGRVRLIDFMPLRGGWPDLIRIVEGVEGTVPMRMELIVRYDYGAVVPWVRRQGNDLTALAGPDGLVLRTPAEIHGEGMTTVSTFDVRPGQRVPFVLTWYPSHEDPPPALHADSELEDTTRWWETWAAQCEYEGPWRDAVMRSLLVLKALTFAPTGGITAAVTTSLPENPGGVRNWDYRYCWLRDATLSLYALMTGGYRDEAEAWREWLLRAVAGDPARLQIMYGVAGERRLKEFELPWLSGFAQSKPVRVGNAASEQFQLDVYGEVVDALFQSRRMGIPPDEWAWRVELEVLRFLEGHWNKPDNGIWEVRGERRQFTHSKVMAWAAFDRAVRTVEHFGQKGPVDRWRAIRDRIHQEVLEKAFDPERQTFTQFYGSQELDAALLLIPTVGFLPREDPRVAGTVRAIEKELMVGGLVRRYSESAGGAVDGVPGGEGVFLACSFWLADNYALLGRTEDAEGLFERLLALRNDVGLLSEEYSPEHQRLLGNFPQAFSHMALVNTAFNLARHDQAAAFHRSNHRNHHATHVVH